VAGVRDVDKGAREFLKRIARGQLTVRVGVFGDAAAEKHKDGDATVGQIANAHEHGLGPPERSWLRGTVDENRSKIDAALQKAAEQVFIKRTLTADQALQQIGEGVAGMCKQRIADGVPPALGWSEGSKRYLRRKLLAYPGATTALIASGQFRGSITAAVVRK
jgi:hypothetical protein